MVFRTQITKCIFRISELSAALTILLQDQWYYFNSNDDMLLMVYVHCIQGVHTLCIKSHSSWLSYFGSTCINKTMLQSLISTLELCLMASLQILFYSHFFCFEEKFIQQFSDAKTLSTSWSLWHAHGQLAGFHVQCDFSEYSYLSVWKCIHLVVFQNLSSGN